MDDVRPLAVHFGAGAIGRGFLGQLYFESGYDTVFVDVDPVLIEGLRTRGRYPIRIVEPVQTIWIERVTAVDARDAASVGEAIRRASILSTSVGVAALPKVAVALARALGERFAGPNGAAVDVMICENLLQAGPAMRGWVSEAAGNPGWLERVGFVETSIGRMVPVMTDVQRAEDPLLVCVEAYCELPVDGSAFRAGVPSIRHLAPKPDFGAYVERKLFLHNTGHACAAYLGWARGFEFVWQAMEEPQIAGIVERAMAETSLALHRKHGLPLADLREHAADLRRRFSSRALADQIARVAGDPVRKLGPQDRLIGALRLCIGQGVEPVHVSMAVAAALRYGEPSDPAASEIQRLGWDGVLREISGMTPGEPAWEWVVQAL